MMAPSVHVLPTADAGRSALLWHLGPTPGLARRSLGATATSTPPARNAAAAGLIAGRHGLCRIWPERAGRGASTRGSRARHKNDTHEERTHETQSQTVFDRGGNRPRRLGRGR